MRSSRGSISALVVSLVSTFALLSGLAFDGGRVVNTYVQLSDVAENAARLGAQNIIGIRAGNPRIDPGRAAESMDDFLGHFALTGRYQFSGMTVTIAVSRNLPMTTMRFVGVTSRRVTVHRKVTVVGG